MTPLFLSTLVLLSMDRWFGFVKEQASSILSNRPWKRIKVANEHHRFQYAILVDAENIPPSSLEFIVQDIVVTKDADAPVRRVYGDFNKPNLSPAWKATCLQFSFLPIHAFSYVSGKGTSDSAMIIDAMEMLYTNPVIDGFALVTSDSDFTRLAQRLREAGKHVVGFGSEKTPSPFCVACERFVYIENLMKKHQQQLSSSAVEFLYQIIESHCDANEASDGWVICSLVGDALKESQQFSLKHLGYSSLVKLLQAHPQYFELRKKKNKGTYSVRRTGYITSKATPTATIAITGKTTLPLSVIQTIDMRIQEFSDSSSSSSGNDGWVECGFVGQVVTAKNYGYKNLNDLLRDYPQHFELKKVKKNGWVRRSSTTAAINNNNIPSPSSSITGNTANNNKSNISTKPAPFAIIQALTKKINENGDIDGWVQCGVVGSLVKAKKKFGYTNLVALLRDYPQHFEVRVGNDESSYYVRCCAGAEFAIISPVVNDNTTTTTTANVDM